jgi:hypothetical protein
MRPAVGAEPKPDVLALLRTLTLLNWLFMEVRTMSLEPVPFFLNALWDFRPIRPMEPAFPATIDQLSSVSLQIDYEWFMIHSYFRQRIWLTGRVWEFGEKPCALHD